ncbi:MAG: DNA-binding protein [Oscillospiraceae bacterium]
MWVKKMGDTLVVRVDRGEEIVAKLLQVATDYDVQAATVIGIGAADHAIFGAYQADKKQYASVERRGNLEITGLTGDLSRKDGAPHAHLHITMADESGNAFGGHLNEATIGGTSEIFVRVLDGALTRRYDDVTGLQIIS